MLAFILRRIAQAVLVMLVVGLIAFSLFTFVGDPGHAATLRWAAQNDILTLDPHSQNHSTTHAIMQHVYEGLTRYTKDFQVESCLATSWEQITPTHWRFHLRKGVKFHDGSPTRARTRQPADGESRVLVAVRAEFMTAAAHSAAEQVAA